MIVLRVIVGLFVVSLIALFWFLRRYGNVNK